jgi:hypothetical protein
VFSANGAVSFKPGATPRVGAPNPKIQAPIPRWRDQTQVLLTEGNEANEGNQRGENGGNRETETFAVSVISCSPGFFLQKKTKEAKDQNLRCLCYLLFKRFPIRVLA